MSGSGDNGGTHGRLVPTLPGAGSGPAGGGRQGYGGGEG